MDTSVQEAEVMVKNGEDDERDELLEWKGGERGYTPFIATTERVYEGYPGESHIQLLIAYLHKEGDKAGDALRAYYSPEQNHLQFTSHPQDSVPKKQLDVLYDYLSSRYDDVGFGMNTRITFLGGYESTQLGKVYSKAYAERRPAEQTFVRSYGRKIGVYPSGKYYRERKLDPKLCQPGTTRTKDVGKPGGHKIIVCRPLGSKTTRTQSVLHPRTESERKKLKLPRGI